jgi:hypothetical protein
MLHQRAGAAENDRGKDPEIAQDSEAWMAWIARSLVFLINACFLCSIKIKDGQRLSPLRIEPVSVASQALQ